ncbi:MAG TPA: hypothetical protein VLE99_00625 [Candidatus Saccharimonadales bacterium]|nr:hypothetical protein [Candidatus Saccharimonadales bacterium]
MDELQPGQLVVPHGPQDAKPSSDGAPEPDRHPSEEPGADADPAPTPTPTPEPSASVSQKAAVSQPEESPWQFASETSMLNQHSVPDDISWTASEYIAHDKGTNWYVALAAGAVGAAALDYVITKDKISSVVILLAAAMFGLYAGHKPRVLEYALSLQGLLIGDKMYSFQDYKNFSVVPEGGIASIVFMPLKRFTPLLTVYVAPDKEDAVIDFLSQVLPFEHHRPDPVDGLLRRIHF